VTFRNLLLTAAISSPDHPVWQWLDKRRRHIAGLDLTLRLELLGVDATQDADQLPDWKQPLQTLSGISGLQLRVELVGGIADLHHPFLAQGVKQHGQLVRHLTVEVHVSENRLKLRDFSEAAALCRSIDLTIRHPPRHVLDLADLDPVAGSLQRLTCSPTGERVNTYDLGRFRGGSALISLSQITALHLDREVWVEDFEYEEPWGLLATLRSLQELSVRVRADGGDPSQLSALTRLSTLKLHSLWSGALAADGPAPDSFSSLQPLSTLQHLEELYLGEYACAATSLQGLAGLSNLKLRGLESNHTRGNTIITLEGVSPTVKEFSMAFSLDLRDVAGIERCTSLEKLVLHECGVSSLQPLRGLSSVKHLMVSMCPMLSSLEGLNNMSLQSLSLTGCEDLYDLSGLEDFSALTSLEFVHCPLTSLQPLSQLGEGLQKLRVYDCLGGEDEVLELPHVKPTAEVVVQCEAKVVVLWQGVLRRR
jgi:hypothetical protein